MAYKRQSSMPYGLNDELRQKMLARREADALLENAPLDSLVRALAYLKDEGMQYSNLTKP